MNMLKAFWRDEEGLTMVEYAVAGALIIVVAIGAFRTLGTNVSTTMDKVNSALT
jgi:pilus assembly protein Flp/PilA